MINRRLLLQFLYFGLITYSNATHAAPISWIAQSPNNNMNDASNWNPSTIPGSSDSAIFSSFTPGISTNPTENSAPFLVSAFDFPSSSSNFNFHFNNQPLTFNGIGIIGSTPSPTINVNNTNNTSFPGDLISFVGSTGTSASSKITSINSGILAGNLSGISTASINSHLHSTGNFTMTDGGSILAANAGNDSTSGTGNNGTANTGASQLKFDQSFAAGNNVDIAISNSGTFSGINSVQGNAVSIINGSQFISLGAFTAGNNFNCEVQNRGTDSSQGIGLNNIGQLNAAQMILQTTAIVGNNCTLTLTNTSINSSQTSNFPDFIGYLNDQQFFAGNTFQAGDNFSINATNTGLDNSAGYGGYQVAVINSNSGTTGNQILFREGCIFGNHATVVANNSGSYSGTNTNGGSNTAGMNLQQIAFGESTAPGSHTFIAADYFRLSASNSGGDSSDGLGGNATGTVSSDQIVFFTPLLLGNHASIEITNSGNYAGNATTTYVNVGSTGGSQLHCASSASIGDNFTLNISNSGTNTGTGTGGYFIGDLITGQQVNFENNLVIGNNASITLSNNGSNSSTTTNSNQIGSFMGYGKQFRAASLFQVGDDFELEISNTGFDESIGSGGNFVAFMNNNTVDNSASQLHLAQGAMLGDRASITLSNTGTYQGSNTITGNIVSVLAGQQLYSVNDFTAGNNFSLTVSNSGTKNSVGNSDNSTGTIGSTQVEFGGDCNLGNNASIRLSNSGINNDTTGNFNNIGLVNGTQMLVDGNFSAGAGLTIAATNIGSNFGTSRVGVVGFCQLYFANNCTLSDGSTISAFNSGTVDNSQLYFGQGFNIVSGSITIQAVNEGNVNSFGIDIQGNNSGGNAHIILGNSSLNIGATLPTFTIAGLEGDSTSYAQSLPQLVINTPASTRAEFAGVIQDYPATNSTLMKMGAGIQKLSGLNTYTGQTTVQEGVLILNGSLGGNVLISPIGTLKGNGTIAGTLTNAGTVSPGESIGLINVGNYINNDGIYAIEVNGAGQSDLIASTGTATLNGGTAVVSSVDGTFRFQQPYTIITTQGGLAGTFTNVSSSAFIAPNLTYDLNNVYLTIQSALLKAAEKCNQYGVATNLDNVVNPNASESLLIGAIANLPLSAAQRALESLSGFQYTNEVLISNISTSRLLRRLYDPLRPIVTGYECSSCSTAPSNEWTPWFETGYGFTNLNGENAHKTNFNSYQVTGGIQRTFRNTLTMGIAGSYEYDHVNYRDGSANHNTGYGSVYGLFRPNAYYGLFDIVYGYSANRLKRTIGTGNLQYKAHSHPNCNNFTFYGEAGLDIKCDSLLVQPFLGIQTGKNWRDSISENKGNNWNLAINKHDWSTTSSRLGFHISSYNWCDCIDASLDLAWNQLLSSSKNSTVACFKDFGTPFTVCGNKLDTYSFDYALTLLTCFSHGIQGYIELDGEWWQHANTFNVQAGINYSW